jgi:hypothetical protein
VVAAAGAQPPARRSASWRWARAPIASRPSGGLAARAAAWAIARDRPRAAASAEAAAQGWRGGGRGQRRPGLALVSRIVGDHHRVAAGGDRRDRGRADALAIGDRGHVEIVGDDQAAVAELAAQQVGDDRARQGRRRGRVEGRVDDVGGHDHRQRRGHGRERRQLDGLEAGPRLVDHGNPRWLSTAVSPWPGKCLPQARTPASARPAASAAARRPTSAAVRPSARSPITGLVGLVRTSSTGARLTSTPRAASSTPWARADRPRQLDVGGAVALEGQHRRPLRGRRADALDRAAFVIEGDQDRRVLGRGGADGGGPRDQRGDVGDPLRHRTGLDGGAQVVAAEDDAPQGLARDRRPQPATRRGAVDAQPQHPADVGGDRHGALVSVARTSGRRTP